MLAYPWNTLRSPWIALFFDLSGTDTFTGTFTAPSANSGTRPSGTAQRPIDFLKRLASANMSTLANT